MLIQACENDDIHEVSELIDPLMEDLDTDAKKDELLVTLFVDDYEDDSPLEATIRVAGTGGTGQARMRLYMLDALSACGPHERFMGMEDHPAFDPRLQCSNFHEQYLRFMARLGALARPYATINSEGHEELDREMMRMMLEEFIDLPHDSIGLCVANGFFEEYHEIRNVLVEFGGIDPDTQVAIRDRLSSDFPNDRDRKNLGVAFSTAIQMAKDAFIVSDELKLELRLPDASRFKELSRRLQAAVATALDTLGDDVSYLLIRHHKGRAAMSLATLEGMRMFLTAPSVRGAVRRMWLGENLFRLATASSFSLSGWLAQVGLTAANLAALPLVAATPWIPHWRSSHWGWVRVFGHRDNYLLQVACFQAFIYQAIDLLLTLYVTFHIQTLPFIGFFWTCSSLWFEVGQFLRSIEVQSISERVDAFGAYLVQDMFNLIDIPTLLLCAWAFQYEWRKQMGTGADDGEGVESSLRQLRSRGGGGTLSSSDVLIEDVSFDISSPNFTSLESVAVLFMWFRQLRPLGLISNAFSDLVQMLVAMLKDVLLFLVLFVVVLMGFAAALVHLVTEDDIADVPGECTEMMVRLNSVSSAVLILFEGALLGNVSPIIECMRVTSHAAIGVSLLFIFMLLSILMLLNMIIAIMGQTFSNFYAAAQEEGALYFSRIVQDWEEDTAQPPLVNLLATPWALVVYARRAFAALLTALGYDASWVETSWQLSSGTRPTTQRPKRLMGTFVSRHDPQRALLGDSMSQAIKSSYEMLNEDIEYPEGASTLDEMKTAIGEVLETHFGAWESTGQLLDTAVQTLSKELQELSRRLDEQGRKLGINKQQREKKDRNWEKDRWGVRNRTRTRPRSRRDAGGGGILTGIVHEAAAPLSGLRAATHQAADIISRGAMNITRGGGASRRDSRGGGVREVSL